MGQDGDSTANGAFVSIEFEVFGQVQGKIIQFLILRRIIKYTCTMLIRSAINCTVNHFLFFIISLIFSNRSVLHEILQRYE